MELKHLENTTLNSYKSVHKGLSAFNTGTLRRKRESVRSTWVNYKSSLYTIVSIFLPAKFPTFAHFLMEVALSKKPNKRMGEEVESWTNQRQSQIIPGNLMGLLRFYVGCQHPLNISRFTASLILGLILKATPRLSYFIPHCPFGDLQAEKNVVSRSKCHGAGRQLWTLLSTYYADGTEHLCPHHWGSWEPGLCLQPLQYRDLGFVHSPWSVTLDKRTRLQLGSVCLVDKGHHRGPMLRTLVLGANKLC